jgi:hypothetical protein
MFSLILKNCVRADGRISRKRTHTELRRLTEFVAVLLIDLLLILSITGGAVAFIKYSREVMGQDGFLGNALLFLLVTPSTALVLKHCIDRIAKYRRQVLAQKKAYRLHDAEKCIDKNETPQFQI